MERRKCPRCGFLYTPRKEASSGSASKGYGKAFQMWTAEDTDLLVKLFKEGKNIADIAVALERQPGAIRYRIELLRLTRPSVSDAAAFSEPDPVQEAVEVPAVNGTAYLEGDDK